MRIVARIEQVAQRAAHRPVDVFARAVDAGKRLFVQQARHAVLLRHTRQREHDHLLMVGRHVGVFVDRRDFVLRRRHFVVTRFDGHAQFVQLALRFQHACQDTLGNGAEVVVFEFLSLGRLGAVQGAAGSHQVRPAEEEVPVDQEVFLLRTGRRNDGRKVGMPEQLQNALTRACSEPASSATPASSCRALRRSTNRTPWECRAWCRWDFPGCTRDWSGPTRCSRALRTWHECRPRESSTRRARPESVPCPRIRPMRVPSPIGAKKLSCFSAVRPVSG